MNTLIRLHFDRLVTEGDIPPRSTNSDLSEWSSQLANVLPLCLPRLGVYDPRKSKGVDYKLKRCPVMSLDSFPSFRHVLNRGVIVPKESKGTRSERNRSD